MEEYFPDVLAILEKHKKDRALLRGTGVLFRNTRPPQTELPKTRERGGEREGENYERGPGGSVQRVGGGNEGEEGEGETSSSHTLTQADRNQGADGSLPAPVPPNENGEEREETDPQALTDSSKKGDLLKAKHIIECGRAKLSLDWQDENGMTALLWASLNGHTDIVRLLVDAKANVDIQDQPGMTALMGASVNGHTDIVRLLVDAKANVDMQDRIHKKTALLWASDEGHTDIVRLLVDAKANVNMQDQAGMTALMGASVNGHTEVVRLLVDAKANVDMQDRIYRKTALLWASNKGHTDIVRLLVDAKANVDMQDKEGNSVLMLAIEKENVAMVEHLLARPGGATQTFVNIPDSQGRTPLFRAAAGGHILLVELLLRRGADPSLRDASGNTALAVAEDAGKLHVVERLKSGERMVDPWSTEMVSEWNDLRSLIDSEAVAFWPLDFLRSLLKKGAKLPYRQKIAETAKDLGVVCEPFSARRLAADLRHPVGAPFKLVAVSYPWLSQEHPDPEGFRLRSVLKHLDKQWWAQDGSPVTVFVFWDYLSLFQHPPGERRTDAQDALFKEGLCKMDLIYSSPHTHVIRSTAVPESAANPTKCVDRGWCWFESAVTAFKPPAQVLSDDSDQERPSLSVPATPLRFGETLDTKKFTNGKADAEGVKVLYKNFLRRSTHKLRVFAEGSWASSREARKQMDPQAALQLAALVEYVGADPSLAARLQPQVLDLRGSPFDDAALEIYDDFLSLEESSELTLSLERLLCAFGKLGSITAVSFEALGVSRRLDNASKKVYMDGLQRGLAGLFPAEGPCPLDTTLPLLASAGMTEVIGRMIRESKTVNVDVRDEERGKTALMGATRTLCGCWSMRRPT